MAGVLTILGIVSEVEVEEQIQRTLQDFLIRPHAYSRVGDLAAGLERLGGEDPPQMLILHHDAHTAHALTLLEHLRRHDIDLPVIIVARRTDGGLAADAMNAGAAAFVTVEELNTARLAQAVDQAYLERRARQELQERDVLLRHQNEQLQTLTKAKDDFIATVSHELRTPLLNVQEGLSLLLDGAHGPLAPPQQEFLKLIHENVTGLSRFLNDLLDMSKLAAGRTKLDRRTLNVVQLAADVVQSSRTLVAQHHLVNRIAEPLPEVYADRSRLTQVFINLVGNAVKYTPAGGTITLSAAAKEAAVEVTVADTGMGIAKEHLGKLFEQYQQVGGASSVHKGTGLGLALCKELIELHHGTIRAESEEGQGTRFIFTLPRFTALTAFAESLTQLAVQARKEQRGVCVAALDVTAWRAAYPTPPLTWDAIGQRFEQIIQQQIHHGEQVLRLHDTTCIILAVIDAAGLRTLCQRIEPLLIADMQQVVRVTEWLPLPLQCAVYPLDGDQPEELLARAQPPGEPLNKRLLLADSAPAALASARTRLELAGYEVVIVGTGPEALARIRQGGIDVAVIDLQLPGIGGFDLCQQLKAEPSTAAVPVVLTVAAEAVTSTIDDRCIGVGAFGWLRTPWTTPELLELLQRALDESSQSFKW